MGPPPARYIGAICFVIVPRAKCFRSAGLASVENSKHGRLVGRKKRVLRSRDGPLFHAGVLHARALSKNLSVPCVIYGQLLNARREKKKASEKVRSRAQCNALFIYGNRDIAASGSSVQQTGQSRDNLRAFKTRGHRVTSVRVIPCGEQVSRGRRFILDERRNTGPAAICHAGTKIENAYVRGQVIKRSTLARTSLIRNKTQLNGTEERGISLSARENEALAVKYGSYLSLFSLSFCCFTRKSPAPVIADKSTVGRKSVSFFIGT